MLKGLVRKETTLPMKCLCFGQFSEGKGNVLRDFCLSILFHSKQKSSFICIAGRLPLHGFILICIIYNSESFTVPFPFCILGKGPRVR